MLKSALIHRKSYCLVDRTFGNYLALHHLQKPYVVGFCSKELCSRAQMYSQDTNQYQLTQHFTQNLLADATVIQRANWNEIGITEMNVNFDGNIHLQKRILEEEEQCQIRELSTDQYVMFPFAKKLGIVLCKDIVEENHEAIVFQGIIIEANHIR